MAGYSGTPLIKKLGIKEDARVIFINEPANLFSNLGDFPLDFARGKPKGVKTEQRLTGKYDCIHYFAFSKAELEAFFKIVSKYLKKDGMLWISWGKLRPGSGEGKGARLRAERDSGGNVHDLNENIVRQIGLKSGLVDVKVAAIDNTWSGLKFVYRLKDR